MTIPATIHSGDLAKYAEFDATHWFATASPERILKLARDGWHGAAAVEIARSPGVTNPAVTDLLAYAMFLRHGGLECATACSVDAVAALEWLAYHRPEVLASLRRAA
jgi:hypothetical protein